MHNFALAENLRRWLAREVTLPWGELDGQPVTAALVFVTREGGPLTRRHHFVSVVLHGGVSIRALAEYLGHMDPGFTLRTYAHLMPSSEDRAREAVDAVLGRFVRGLDGARAVR